MHWPAFGTTSQPPPMPPRPRPLVSRYVVPVMVTFTGTCPCGREAMFTTENVAGGGRIVDIDCVCEER